MKSAPGKWGVGRELTQTAAAFGLLKQGQYKLDAEARDPDGDRRSVWGQKCNRQVTGMMGQRTGTADKEV